MSASIYYDLLDGAEQAVQSLAGVAATCQTILRAEPVLVAMQDRFPQIVVACDPDLAESREPNEQYFGGHLVGYEVYVLLVTEKRWSREMLQWRLERRAEIFAAMYKVRLLVGVEARQFDVFYDPKPIIDRSWLKDTLHMTAQKFTYKTAEEVVV